MKVSIPIIIAIIAVGCTMKPIQRNYIISEKNSHPLQEEELTTSENCTPDLASSVEEL